MSPKQLLALAFVLLITHIPISCCNHSCCGENLETQYYELHQIKLISGKRVFNMSANQVQEMSLETLDLTEIAFAITADSISMYAHVHHQEMRGSLLNAAYACSPNEPIPVNPVNSLNIFADDTLRTSTSVIPPGTDANDFFDVYLSNYPIADGIGFFNFKNDAQRGFSAVFFFELQFDDGSSLSFQTERVTK